MSEPAEDSDGKGVCNNADDIHSKSKKVYGFHLSVSKNLRKKCVNHDDKISRQKCVNQSKVVRNASFENKMSK